MNIFMNLLALDVPNEPVAIPESLLIAVLGMVIIFVVLAVLILIIMLLEQVFKLKFMQEKTKKVEIATSDTALDEQDEETVAAISAAITVLLSEERKEGEVAAVAPFRIRSIKRVK